jgi:hypothetical protein
MDEITCPWCGAIIPAQDTPNLCPHCHKEFSPGLSRLRRYFSQNAWIILYVAWLAYASFAILKIRDWRYPAIAGAIFFGGLVLFFFMKSGRRGLGDTMNYLSPRPTTSQENFTSSLVQRPPDTPRQWKALISLPPPREVVLGASFKAHLLILWLVVFLNLGLALACLSESRAGRTNLRILGIAAIAYLSLPLYSAIIANRREKIARSMLRDGIATVGFWRDQSYRYWTQSGECFEHRGVIVSGHEVVLTDSGLVPVFYSREDPARSVALCCVWSRVRVPSVPQISEVGSMAVGS